VATTDGTYYLAAGSSTAGGTGTYKIFATDVTPPPANDPLDNVNTTAVLTTTIDGTIDAEPSVGSTQNISDGNGGLIDKDWYKLSLNKGQLYTFSGTANSLTTGLIDISLYSSVGTQVHTPVEGAAPSFQFDTSLQASPTQTYYLAVSAGGSGSTWKTATGGYSLGLNVQTATITADQIPETILSTVPLPVNATTIGTIDASDLSGGQDDDYYKVTLTGGERYTFIASAGNNADTLDSVIIRLRDSNGDALSPDETASGPNPNFEFSTPGAGPQTYYLAISASNVGSSNGVAATAQTGQYSITVDDDGANSSANFSSPSDTGRSTSTLNGIDSIYAYNLTPSQIVQNGNQFVIRYIGGPDPIQGKYFNSAEAKALLDARLSIVSVFERHILYDGNTPVDDAPTHISYFTPQQADADAVAAIQGAQTSGQIGGAIYFAVDMSPGIGHTTQENAGLAAIDAYFQEISSYFSRNDVPYQIGVYGPADVLVSVGLQ
jgi:hypothetical protein